MKPMCPKWYINAIVKERLKLGENFPEFIELTSVDMFYEAYLLTAGGRYNVYQLFSGTNVPLYIGRTNYLAGRYRQHLEGQFPATKEVIFELAKEGIRTEIEILECCETEEQAKKAEAFHLWQMRKRNIRLLNKQMPTLFSDHATPEWLSEEEQQSVYVQFAGDPDKKTYMSSFGEVSWSLAHKIHDEIVSRPVIETLIGDPDIKAAAAKHKITYQEARRIAKKIGIIPERLSPLEKNLEARIVEALLDNPDALQVAKEFGLPYSRVQRIAVKNQICLGKKKP